ncbi:MAG: heme-binding protein [Planctomycetes bacterium]|nr:heme-binding protein [Planctomycetota bacterium]
MPRIALVLLPLLMPLAVAAQAAPAAARVLQPDDLEGRGRATALLATALLTTALPGPRATPPSDPAVVLQAAARCLPPGSAARERVDAALASPRTADELRSAIADLHADLTFRPVAEADLPEGFPGFAAVDELELRAYPAYRMVRTTMRGGSMGAFWPLFRHIQQREIAMTTPVQVDYDAAVDRARTMAFLYGSPDLGEAGPDGRVEVVDVPAMTVLSIGSRGYERPDRVAELRGRLQAWLAASPTWEAAGPLRTMAYNSPSVGADRRYFEVQLPIRPRPDGAPADADADAGR